MVDRSNQEMVQLIEEVLNRHYIPVVKEMVQEIINQNFSEVIDNHLAYLLANKYSVKFQLEQMSFQGRMNG